ncbi:MAG: Hsp20/alpha crystallin family protein [Candidatus Eisenbacteria bacterium]|jgi:HSP20 family protein
MPHTPSNPLENLQREVERLFHDLVYHRHPSAHFAEQPWLPPADLVVSETSARVILELAGVPRGNVRVRLRGRLLEVSGRRTPPQEPAGAHYHRAEIYFGEFSRVIELPWEADEDSVTATYRDGMLEIHLLPSPAPRPTDVPVRESTP